MEPELVVFASFRAYRTLAILAFESKSSSPLPADSGPNSCLEHSLRSQHPHLSARSRLGSRRRYFDRLTCLQFLGILDFVQLLNLFHTDSILLRNLNQCFSFCHDVSPYISSVRG